MDIDINMSNLKSKIQSILFIANKPVSTKSLAKILDTDTSQIETALQELMTEHKEAGIVLLEANGEYQLATNGQNAQAVKDFLNSDLREKLTDATVEVLAIIAYRQPISKAEVEAIRGVNSQYSLRHLLMRGLVEKIPNPHDARGSFYQVTTEFLQHLGLTNTKDLPEFDSLVEKIKLPDNPNAQEEKTAD
jgi:segregation and condensation protein B